MSLRSDLTVPAARPAPPPARVAALALAAALGLGALAASAQTGPAAPVKPRASTGAHPAWLFGPDGPIMPPMRFAPRAAPSPEAVAPAVGAIPCALAPAPACAADPATYRSASSRKACEAQVSAHVKNVFAYRQCLDAEMTRATLSVNEAIRRLKCGRPRTDGCG